ncbi:MAG: polysaccharide pyruvyl transferase family protein [Verrucomicrobia bacterium]|nr:polysaccharide pyruvyl transferase family protein [Verrucomicrobiota bacterium]
MSSILISNVYSTRNKGDQALFESLLDICGPRHVHAVAAADYSEVSKSYPGVRVIRLPWESRSKNRFKKRFNNLLGLLLFCLDILLIRGRFTELGCAFRRSKLVVACAGGYLEDTSVSYYGMLVQIWAAVFLRKQILLAPQSIGPFRKKWNQRLCSSIIGRATSIYIRENLSLSFLSDTAKEKAVFSPDLVLANVNYSRPRLREATQPRPVVGITLVDAVYYLGRDAATEYIRKIVCVLDELETRGVDVEIVTQTIGFAGGTSDEDMIDDVLRARQVVRRKMVPDIASYLEIISGYDAFCGSRLHSCLFALKRRVPAVCLSYQPKAQGIYENLQLSEFVQSIETFNPAHVSDQLVRLCTDPVFSASIQARLDAAIVKVEECGRQFVEDVRRRR